MSRRKTKPREKSRLEDPQLCCEIAELLDRCRQATPHLEAAKRELLLFVKAIVDHELEEMDHAKGRNPRARRRICIKQV